MRVIPNTSILVLVLIGLVISLYGLTGLRANADYRVYFDPEDTLLQKDRALGQQYSQTDSLLLILEAKKGSLLEPELLAIYPSLETHFYNIEYVERIRSFFQFLQNDNTFEFEQEILDEKESDENSLLRLRNHPRAVNLITADGRFGLLEIGVALPGINTAKEVKQFMADVEIVLNEQFISNESSVAVHYSGTLALNEAYIDVVRHDLKRFVPCLLFIFLFCLFLFFRSWRISFLLIGISFLTALATFGLVGWLGWELAAINAFTPIIIMSLNIATAMHIVVNYFRFVAEGNLRIDAMRKSISYNLAALTLSKITTALGFLLLLFSPSPPVQVVGYAVAIGMLISYLLVLTLLRIILPMVPLSIKQAKNSVERFSLGRLGQQTLKHSNNIIILSAGLFIISLVALQQLQINDNVYEYFPEEHRFRQGTQIIDSQFDGSIRLFYSIDSGKNFGVLEPEYVNKFSAFTNWLRKQEIVARVDDVFSQAAKKGIELEKRQSFLELNSPDMLGLEQELTENYSATKVSVFLKSVTAKDIISFDKKVRAWLELNMSPYDYNGGVGPDLLFARLGERNAKSMFFSLILALSFIALITGILIRSCSAAFIGLFCNLFPVIIVFALWSLVGGYISLGSAMVMGMIMGIIVDDTLHMLLKFPRSKEKSNTSSILVLFDKVGPAIVITSITLAAGLFVGIFSGFRPIYELSVLSLSIILIAMLADLLLLPALMKSLNFRRT